MSNRAFEIIFGVAALFVALYLTNVGISSSRPLNGRFWVMLCISGFMMGWGIAAVYPVMTWIDKLLSGGIGSFAMTATTISRRRYFRSLKRK